VHERVAGNVASAAGAGAVIVHGIPGVNLSNQFGPVIFGQNLHELHKKLNVYKTKIFLIFSFFFDF
jgi:hypothetical protein